MPLEFEEFSDLVARIYATSARPELWPEVLHQISGIFPGIKTQLFGHDMPTGNVLGLISHGYGQDYIASYLDYYGSFNPWAPAFETMALGKPASAERMRPAKIVERTEFYADWIRPQEDVIGGGGLVLFRETDRFVAFGGNCRRRDIETLEPEWIEFVAQLSPHLRQTFELSRAMIGQSFRTEVETGSTQQGNSAVYLLNPQGRVLFRGGRAAELSAAGNLLREDRNSVLHFNAAGPASRLSRALHDLRSANRRPVDSFTITHPETSRPIQCRLAYLHPQHLDDARMFVLAGRDEPCLVLTLSPPHAETSALAALHHRYGLSEAEALIALALADGKTVREIADNRRSSVHTVRNQLKSVMSKMGVNRQAQLVATVIRLH